METYQLLIIYLVFFAIAIIFSFLINGLFLKFAHNLGIRNAEKSGTVIRWGNTSKPALGGISFYLLFLFSVGCYSIFIAPSVHSFDQQILGLIGCCTIGFLIGLADDAYDTRPFLKFIGQLSCGLILIATGTYIKLFVEDYLNYLLTLFWVVGIMNSINMLDNMDAITTIVSIFILMSALLILYLDNNLTHIHIILLIGVLGALFGFLYYNWYPSKIYMGDTGSQFLGAFLAAIGIIYCWNNSNPSGNMIQAKQIVVSILTFMLPVIDTTTVVINRLRNGKSPFVGGKDHTTHHLFFLGLNARKVAFIFVALSLISMVLTVIIIKFIPDWSHFHTALFGSYILFVFSLLYYTTRIPKKKIKS